MQTEGWHQITPLHGKYGVPMRLHNVVSYAVTLLVFPGVVLLSHGKPAESLAHLAQQPLLALALLLWALHFARRTAESAWVHRYSKPPAPYVGVLLEYIYYWGQGSFIAYTLAAPDYRFTGGLQLFAGVAFFAVAEAGNAWSHWRLHTLRAPGETAHRIPWGGMFERVSSPHYFFEIVAWWGFALAFPCWGTLIFASLTTAILLNWGLSRHRSYQRTFDGQEGRALYPKQRRAVLPFVF